MAILKGRGSKLFCELVPPTYTLISQRMSIDGPDLSVGTEDVSHLDSSQAEFLPTLPDGGTVNMTVWLDPDDTTHTALFDLWKTPALVNWRLELTDSTPTKYEFAGILTGYKITGIEPTTHVKAEIAVKVSGDVVKS